MSRPSASVPISRQVLLLLRISFLVTFAESMLVPIYAVFAEKVGGSLLDAGVSFAVFSIATGAIVALLGTRPLFQRHIKHFLVLGLLVSVVCDVSYIFVHSRWQLFAAQVVAGLATGLIEPAWDTVFSDHIEESSAKHWSIWAGGTHSVSGVAALAGGVVVAHFSFTVLFLIMAAIDGLAAFLTCTAKLRLTSNGPAVEPVRLD